MTRILSLDPASSTGVADGKAGGVPRLTVWRLRGSEDDEAHDIFRRAANLLWLRVSLERPDVMAIEMPVPPHAAKGYTQYKTSLIALGLYGLYTGIAGAARIKVMPAHVATWRKAVLGKGNLKGDEAKRRMVGICRQLGWEAPNHDAAEAAGIWMWAEGQLKQGGIAEWRRPDTTSDGQRPLSAG